MQYDCSKCPGFCCSIPIIPVTNQDIKRIATSLSLDVKTTKDRYVKTVNGSVCLKHQKDTVYNSVCRLFCIKTRKCTIYNNRPQVCKNYPYGDRCGYFEKGSALFPNLLAPKLTL